MNDDKFKKEVSYTIFKTYNHSKLNEYGKAQAYRLVRVQYYCGY